jgi:hypothetical protein
MMVNILKKELRLQATKPNASKKQMETLWKRECILFNRAIEAFG